MKTSKRQTQKLFYPKSKTNETQKDVNEDEWKSYIRPIRLLANWPNKLWS